MTQGIDAEYDEPQSESMHGTRSHSLGRRARSRTSAPSRRRGRRWALMGLAATLSLIPAALARASFSAPVTLSAAGGGASNPQIAVDQAGEATVVWQRSDGSNERVQARAIASDGTLGAIHTLSAAGEDAQGPQVAVSAKSIATAVWYRSDGSTNRIQARTIAADGTLGPTHTLSPASQDASYPQVAVDTRGDATVVWGANNRVWARTLAPDGTLGPVLRLDQQGGGQLPRVAADSAGDATVSWWKYDSNAGVKIVQARTIAADGTLGRTKTLSRLGDSTCECSDVAVDSAGDPATVVWSRYDGSNWRVQARTIAPGGTLGPIHTLSAAGEDASDDPEVGVDSTSDATAVWRRFDGSNWRVQARTIAPGGTLGPVHTLSAAGMDAFGPQVGVDSTGDATLVWQRVIGSYYRIQARTIAADGTVAPIQTLSATGDDAADPEIAVDPAGDATAVWTRGDLSSGATSVEASSGP